MAARRPWDVPDGLWVLFEPLLPKRERRFRYPGRKWLGDREALSGILFVLYTGIAWRHLPLELGFGSGATCRRRLDEWQKAGVCDKLHAVLLAQLQQAGEIEWAERGGRRQSRAGEKGGSETGPSPVDRGAEPARNTTSWSMRPGSRSAFSVTGGNRNDVTQLIPLLDRVPPVKGAAGRPRRRPDQVVADRGYDHDKYRLIVRKRGIIPVIARRETEHGSGLGAVRWVVERTFAWLQHFKRLLVRYDRRQEIHEAFLAIGCCLICYRRLQNSF